MGHQRNRRNSSGGNSMSTEENVQTVKDFFAALGSGDKQRLLCSFIDFRTKG
jgi:hypothetical protein